MRTSGAPAFWGIGEGVSVNSKLLEYFLRAAELGSINKAAVDLRLSQPALSRNISLLEHEMGSALFVRSRGGVKLTEAGKLLYDQARPLLRQFAVLKEQIGEIAQGQVAVGLPPSWRSVLTTRFAERLLGGNSGIQIRINETVSHILRDQMTGGLLDICIAPSDNTRNDAYRQTPVVREPLVLAGGPDTGLSPDESISLQVLDGLPMIIPSRPNLMRARLEHEMALQGVALNVAIETDTLALCLELSARGKGYTVVPRCALISMAHIQPIRWAPIDEVDVVWSMFVNARRTHSQAVRYCRQEILRIARATIAEKLWSGAEAL